MKPAEPVRVAEEPEFRPAHLFAQEVGFNPRAFVRLCRKGRVPGARQIGSRWLVCVPEFRAAFREPVSAQEVAETTVPQSPGRRRVPTDSDLDRLFSRALSGVP